jgi:hypothetical protein
MESLNAAENVSLGCQPLAPRPSAPYAGELPFDPTLLAAEPFLISANASPNLRRATFPKRNPLLSMESQSNFFLGKEMLPPSVMQGSADQPSEFMGNQLASS